LSQIYDHWIVSLKPILLSHHNGELHFDWKLPFLEKIVDLKIVKTHDINWIEIQASFPNQTPHSMGMCLKTFRKNSDQPIYERLMEVIPNLKNRNVKNTAVMKHRENIVFLYDKVRGINSQ